MSRMSGFRDDDGENFHQRIASTAIAATAATTAGVRLPRGAARLADGLVTGGGRRRATKVDVTEKKGATLTGCAPELPTLGFSESGSLAPLLELNFQPDAHDAWADEFVDLSERRGVELARPRQYSVSI